MKQELNFLEIRKIVNELSSFINDNSKIEKIYYLGKNNVYFQLYISGIGKQYLHFMDKMLYLTENKQKSDRASSKTLFLRKRLSNARITKIEQIQDERIILLQIQAKEKLYNCYFELYGQNDMILCDEENKVIFSHKYKKNDTFNTDFDFDIDNPSELEAKPTEKIVKVIAKSRKLGKIYGNEVCLRAKIDPNKKFQDITTKEIQALKQSLNKLVREIDNSKESFIIKDKDIVPTQLNFYKDDEIESIKHTIETTDLEKTKKYNISYNTALAKVLDKDIELEKPTEKKEKKDKFKAILDEQKALQKELEDKVDELNKIIEIIYEDYNSFNEFFNEIKTKFNKKEFDEIKKLKHKLKIKEINKKDKKIILEK